MVLKLKDKEAIVADLREVAGNALSVVAADYRGLTVSQLNQLRCTARQSGVCLRVVRNTLSRRALEGTAFKCIQDALVGPVILAFSHEAPGVAARILKDFIVDNEKLTVKAIAVGSELFAANQLEAVAKLPTRDEAIAMLMGVMKAPIVKLARTLNEVNGKLVRTVAAVAAAKEKSAEA